MAANVMSSDVRVLYELGRNREARRVLRVDNLIARLLRQDKENRATESIK